MEVNKKLILPPIGENREGQIIPNNLHIPKEGLGLCKMADSYWFCLPDTS